MNPADLREIDREEGAFFMSTPPDPWKPSEFGHLPQHWYSHCMHALEILGYCHPDPKVRADSHQMYVKMVRNMHLNPETVEQMYERLTEDRITKGEVVS